MLISIRPTGLNNKERGREKTQLVLQWLLELRVSSLDILAARLGLRPNRCSRFFKNLIDRKMIERIKVDYCDKRNLVILGPEGHRVLGTSGISYAAEISRVRRYTKKKTVRHDLECQKAILKLLPDTLEIISDFNVQMQGRRPDALLFKWCRETEKVKSIALEMEKSKKSSDAIYGMLNAYLEILARKQLDEVHFFFSHEDDKALYLRMFQKELWPKTVQKSHKSKMLATTELKKVSVEHPLRKHFLFEILKPGEEPRLFSLKEAAALPRFLSAEDSYLERIKLEKLDLVRRSFNEAEKKEEEQKAREFEERQAQAAEEAQRFEKRNTTIRELRAEIEKAKKEDASAASWRLGYRSRVEDLTKKLIDVLSEELAI